MVQQMHRTTTNQPRRIQQQSSLSHKTTIIQRGSRNSQTRTTTHPPFKRLEDSTETAIQTTTCPGPSTKHRHHHPRNRTASSAIRRTVTPVRSDNRSRCGAVHGSCGGSAEIQGILPFSELKTDWHGIASQEIGLLCLQLQFFLSA